MFLFQFYRRDNAPPQKKAVGSQIGQTGWGRVTPSLAGLRVVLPKEGLGNLPAILRFHMESTKIVKKTSPVQSRVPCVGLTDTFE